VLWIAVAIAAVANVDAAAPNAGDVAGLFGFLGVLVLVAGLVGRFVFRPLVCPRGRVTLLAGYPDKLVELRNVHHAFVAAVTQVHQARAHQAMQEQANVSLPPASN